MVLLNKAAGSFCFCLCGLITRKSTLHWVQDTAGDDGFVLCLPQIADSSVVAQRSFPSPLFCQILGLRLQSTVVSPQNFHTEHNLATACRPAMGHFCYPCIGSGNGRAASTPALCLGVLKTELRGDVRICFSFHFTGPSATLSYCRMSLYSLCHPSHDTSSGELFLSVLSVFHLPTSQRICNYLSCPP